MKVAFLTLGCKVNFYETEKMAEQFCDRGFEVVDMGQQADLYVINTCTVTNIADRKSRQMIHRAKQKNPNSIVVAVGCYVESGGEKLIKDSAVDAVISNKEKGIIADKLIEQFHLQEKIQRKCDQSYLRTEEGKEKAGALGENKPQHVRTRAYLKIQDGCNQFCTYCMIPYVRGRGELVSMPAEKVVKQAEQLARDGFKEVVLTGIHLSSYGVDLAFEDKSKKYHSDTFVEMGGEPLTEVIRQVSGIDGIERIRLGSLEPRIISKKFLEELSKIPKICPHFHLSLQSGCDTVLKRMNRHYTTVEYKERVDLLRKYFKNPAITTDVIVGFPGETEEEFQRTRSYLHEIKLADIHVFKYSERSGTRAAAMENQVRPEVKNERSDCLITDTNEYRKAYGEYFLGQNEKVLFEETIVENDKIYLTGHNERYVKVGVPIEKAEEWGYHSNEIHEVKVEKIFYK